MVLLAQFSDVHLGPLPPVTPADLVSKRIFGYVNWRRNRTRLHDDRVLAALVADMRAAEPDQIVITGDLINLGLPAEFATALAWLRTLGSPREVTAVPGNHDAYVPEAVPWFTGQWREFMTGDGAEPGARTFPFLRRRGALALIGVSTAVATPPLMATGRVGAEQAAALGRLLETAGREGLFRVVLIHHPVAAASTRWHRRLTDADRVRTVLARSGAELVLHGHNHRTSVADIPGPHAPIPVIGAAAGSLRLRPGHGGGAYNLFRIDGGSGTWRVTMTERGITPEGDVATLSERPLPTGG